MKELGNNGYRYTEVLEANAIQMKEMKEAVPYEYKTRAKLIKSKLKTINKARKVRGRGLTSME